jgi:tetratricopeptide (TPR) repeat protein
MKIVENLSALALRQLIDGASLPPGTEAGDGVELGKRLLATQGERVRTVLGRTIDLTWRALEIALAGPSWWEQVRDRVLPSEQAALNEKLPAFFNLSLLKELPAGDADFRQRCRAELHAGRQSDLLGGEPDAGGEANWLPQAAAPDVDRRLVEQIADELRPAFPTLSEFLSPRPGDNSPLLAKLARLCFCREAAATSELAALPAIAALSPADKASLDALADASAQHAQRLDALLTAPVGRDAPRALDIEAETRSAPEPMPQLGRAVLRLLRQYRLSGQEVQPLDSLAIPDQDDRQRIKELVVRVHALNDTLRRKHPALMHGLGLLEAAAGFLEAAQRDLQIAAGGLTDPHLQALVSFNAYRLALEQRDWPLALSWLQRAVQQDPKRFAHFPPDKFEPERILGAEPSGVALLCKHRASNTRVVVKMLWPDGLANPVADLFREARMLDELDHPAMVRLRDCDYADDAKQRPYAVADFFEGTTLADLVAQQGALAPGDLLRIMRVVAELLLSAHERGILHRDLKPTSLLLRKEGPAWRVKLINFGLAVKPAVLFAPLTGPAAFARMTVGLSAATTLPYLAPEHLGLLDGVVPGPTSDIYSFGRLCYYALLGVPEPDDELKEHMPASWRKVLGQCTARQVTRRPPNFQVVLKRLNQLQVAEVERPLPPSAAPSPTPISSATIDLPPATPEAKADPVLLQRYLNRGMAFKRQGNYQRAVAIYSKAISLDPKLLGGYIKRGNAFLECAEFDRAIADYTAALRIEPHNAAAFMNRGLAQAKKGNFDAVIADCSEAIRLDPKLAAAYSIRAAAYWERGERHRAIADYSLALRIDPKNALAYNGRGLAFAEESEYERAIVDYSLALKHEPQLVVAYINRGNAYRFKNEPDKAIADFTRALKLEPRNAMAYYNRALACVARQNYDQAIADYTAVLQLDAKHPDAGLRREEAIQAKAKLGTAPPALPPPPRPAPVPAGTQPLAGPARTTPPPPPGAATRPGAKAAAPAPAAVNPAQPKPRPAPATAPAKPRPAPAVVATKGSAPGTERKPAPKNAADQADEERRQMRAAAYFARGRTFFDQKEYPQAIEQFTKALEVDPRDPLFHYQRGQAYVEKDDFTEALQDFTEAIRLDPKNALAYYQRGLTHRLLGQHDKAIDDYTRALKIDPRLALAYRNRSRAYAAKGDAEKARADYDRAIRLDPNLSKDEE